jgi:hypothetical protein
LTKALAEMAQAATPSILRDSARRIRITSQGRGMGTSNSRTFKAELSEKARASIGKASMGSSTTASR